MKTKSFILFALSIVLVTALVGCQSTPAKNTDPVQVLLKDGFVQQSSGVFNSIVTDMYVILSSRDTIIGVEVGFDPNTGFPRGLAATGALSTVLKDLYRSAVSDWVFKNLSVAAEDLKNNTSYGSCGSTSLMPLKGLVSGDAVKISLDGCLGEIYIVITPGLVAAPPTPVVSAQNQKILSILGGTVGNDCTDTDCSFRGGADANGNDANIMVVLDNSGKATYTVYPLGAYNTWVSTDQLNTLGDLLDKIYGPDMTNWFKKTMSGFSGTATGIINGYQVEIDVKHDSNKNQDYLVLTINSPAQP